MSGERCGYWDGERSCRNKVVTVVPREPGVVREMPLCKKHADKVAAMVRGRYRSLIWALDWRKVDF